MSDLLFTGPIGASKSLLNRALLIQSYFPELVIIGDSHCEDVSAMKSAVESLKNGRVIDCLHAGTVIRFIALRASREKRDFVITGSDRLMERPQSELSLILEQLGVRHEFTKKEIRIFSTGWRDPQKPIQIDRSISSQFASSVLLNAWNLDFDLEFQMNGEKLSESYWEMTLQMVEALGMLILKSDNIYRISRGQKIKKTTLRAETDYSSAFAVAAAGALYKDVSIQNFNLNKNSLQPDKEFLSVFDLMRIHYKLDGTNLYVQKASQLKSIEFNLRNSPDLFPVLAVICAFADGKSRLFGAPHLVHKESNRIQKISDLLTAIGIKHQIQDDGMLIDGNSKPFLNADEFLFNPDKDHRIAMAAGLLKLLGYKIKISDPSVVNKSFPEFWSVIGVSP